MKRMRYIREDAPKTSSKEFGPRRLNEISGIGKKAYVVLMDLYATTPSGRGEKYVLAKKYNLRDAAAAYFKECRECTCLDDSGMNGMISLASYVIGDKENTMNTITYYTNADWFDACDRNGLDANDEITDWSLVTDSRGWKLDGSDIDRMYESAVSKRPAGNPRGRRVLDESIGYSSLRKNKHWLEMLIESMRRSKRLLNALYRGDCIKDDETRDEIFDMYMTVCDMLDRLPESESENA